MRAHYAGRNPAGAVGIDDLQAMAHAHLPAFVMEYVEGGADDEIGLSANLAAFASLGFLPRVLTGVAAPDLRQSLFGRESAAPLLIAPTGFAGLLRRDGDLALARAAATAGIPFVQSMVSNASFTEVRDATPAGSHWAQLYMLRDRTAMQQIIASARSAGSDALVVTVDAHHYGNRTWNTRLYRGEMQLSLRAKLDVARHPGWMRDVYTQGLPGFANLYPFLPGGRHDLMTSSHWVRDAMDPAIDWSLLGWIRAHWDKPLLIKGIGCVEDTGLALSHGADGIILSNHGGRQLDGAAPALTLVAAVRDRVGPDAVILLDGGVRRGSDICKAVALGADAVLAGRAMLYGLGAAGEAGVARAIAILSSEMRLTMALLGAADVAALTRSFITPQLPAARGFDVTR